MRWVRCQTELVSRRGLLLARLTLSTTTGLASHSLCSLIPLQSFRKKPMYVIDRTWDYTKQRAAERNEYRLLQGNGILGDSISCLVTEKVDITKQRTTLLIHEACDQPPRVEGIDVKLQKCLVRRVETRLSPFPSYALPAGAEREVTERNWRRRSDFHSFIFNHPLCYWSGGIDFTS